VAGASSSHGVVAMGEDRAPVLCLREEGRLEPPSPLGAMKNSSVESSIMAHSGIGVPLRGEPMKVTPKSFLLGERFRLLKQSVMNSRLPKQIVSPREKPLHVKHSPLVEIVSADE
jgi:hypothetical protein